MSAYEKRERDERRHDRAESPPSRAKVQLEPMSEEDFRVSLRRAIPRYASEMVHRGTWAKGKAMAASREDFAAILPQGRDTPHKRLCNILDGRTGSRVGETWYTVQEKGGKMQFWVDWIWIAPDYRRRGYATRVLEGMEREAASAGADRVGLHVLAANDGAIALYSKLGYGTTDLRMAKSVRRVHRPRRRARRGPGSS